MANLPKVLVIGGLDSLTGGGIGGDLQVLNSLGVFGTAVQTSVVSILPSGADIHPLPIDSLSSQFSSVSHFMPDVAAIKIGFLGDESQVLSVRRFLESFRGVNHPKVVLDPVLSFKEDDDYYNAKLQLAVNENLLPFADIVTPNRDEMLLLDRTKLTADAVIVKKDVAPESDEAVDEVELAGKASEITKLVEKRIEGKSTEGAGCTFSAAIAARLALGDAPLDAIKYAKAFTTQAINSAVLFKNGGGVVHIQK